jgi:hypothetical protein
MHHSNVQEHERRRQHIEELKQKLECLAGGPVAMGFAPDCPDEIVEKFLESVLAFEEQSERPLFEVLAESGVELPPPGDLEGANLSARLWEVIRAMALSGVYLSHTDHLSDRALYERLWSDTLREPMTLMPQDRDFACHIDLIGSGSEEDIQLYLKHYADEESRREWALDRPEDIITAREPPPYNRNRHLPSHSF